MGVDEVSEELEKKTQKYAYYIYIYQPLSPFGTFGEFFVMIRLRGFSDGSSGVVSGAAFTSSNGHSELHLFLIPDF